MVEIVSIEKAVSLVKPGSSLMGDGFLGVSAPIKLFEGLRDAGTKDLTLLIDDINESKRLCLFLWKNMM